MEQYELYAQRISQWLPQVAVTDADRAARWSPAGTVPLLSHTVLAAAIPPLEDWQSLMVDFGLNRGPEPLDPQWAWMTGLNIAAREECTYLLGAMSALVQAVNLQCAKATDERDAVKPLIAAMFDAVQLLGRRVVYQRMRHVHGAAIADFARAEVEAASGSDMPKEWRDGLSNARKKAATLQLANSHRSRTVPGKPGGFGSGDQSDRGSARPRDPAAGPDFLD